MSAWVLAAAAFSAMSGVPGLVLARGSRLGPRLAAALSCAASALALWAAGRVLAGEVDPGLALPSPVLAMPAMPARLGLELSFRVDRLSAAFLLPIALISALGAVYGLEYWRPAVHPRGGRKLRLFYGLLTSGLILLVSARDGASFLLGWELMALSAFFVVTTEDEKQEVREAGWIYFVSTHLSTLLLFALFALLQSASGSLALEPIPAGRLAPGLANALFLLALLGFGIKAGLYPLHFWLPPAHANAPSHVSALMSGVLIKMGVYGVLRFSAILPEPPFWWGALLLALGCISAVLGVAFALGQHDLKRLLAYHSIENIGIIFIGLGLALMGVSLRRPEWLALGLAGAVLHTWNHGLFKALLFLAAGSVIQASHTREIDQLGGVGKRMPLTALAFLVGAAAICGLPPLNGFVSELLVYLGLFRAAAAAEPASSSLASLAIPVLALIGGLALACFVKVFGAVFLGTPRSSHAGAGGEAGAAMLVPMAALAACCFAIGGAPALFAPLLDGVNAEWAGASAPSLPGLADLAPLGWLSRASVTLFAAAVAGLVWLRASDARRGSERVPTWDCGYAGASPSIQYTASSFAQMLVGLLGWALFPRRRLRSAEGDGQRLAPGFFPGPASFHSEVPDTVLDRALLPGFRGMAWACSRLRILQRGRIHAYLLYIFAALLILLLCT